MKLSTLYEDIDPALLPTGLKSFHDRIVGAAQAKSLRVAHMKMLTEARPVSGLFWIVPDDGGWRTLFWANSRGQLDHETVWFRAMAELVFSKLSSTNSTPPRLAEFRKLFDAYPRGRMEFIDSDQLVVGFGGDLPAGWQTETLLSKLRLKPTTEIEIDEHWQHDPESLLVANKLLGRDDQL